MLKHFAVERGSQGAETPHWSPYTMIDITVQANKKIREPLITPLYLFAGTTRSMKLRVDSFASEMARIYMIDEANTS